VTATVTVLAPVSVPLNLSIKLSPNTAAARDAVRAELADALQRVAVPGGTVTLSQLRRAIDQADGVVDYTILSPTVDKPHAPGQLATLGTITWS
jgi:uncharacterized phage protein gp47/JayE